MKKRVLVFLPFYLSLVSLYSCHSGNTSDQGAFPTDTAAIARGQATFNQYCTGCHHIAQASIGPSLGGLTEAVSADWIRNFIRDPKKIIASGDPRAVRVFAEYKVEMPSFANLSDGEVNGIIAWLHAHKRGGQPVSAAKNGIAVKDPIPQRIPSSGLEVGLSLLAQIPISTDSGKGPMARITKLDIEPSTGRLFVVDLRGKLYELRNGNPSVFMDLAKLRPGFIHEPRVATGFGSFAFHPDFVHNGLLYTSHSERAGSGRADFAYADSIKVALQWVVTEWKVRDPAAATFSGTGRELLRVNMVSAMHGVQEIAFDPLSKPGDKDYGLLYICIGDGASAEEGYPFLDHSLDKAWGSVFRIDPRGRNSRNGKYGIPADNPFVQTRDTATLKEIYAYGFRNPHRITWSKTGQMLVSNIGQANIEAVDLIAPGHDYGWPVREGNFLVDPSTDLDKLYPLPANDSADKITYPIAEYDHDEGQAISGGLEYWGTKIPKLRGKFLFGDIPTGRLFYFEMAEVRQGKKATVREWTIRLNGKPVTLLGLCGSNRVDLHFGRDARGELYILTKADGKVYKLIDVRQQ